MAEASRKRPIGLGRGLSALLGETERTPVGTAEAGAPVGVRMLALTDIAPHPGQPRRRFDDAALAELAESIGTRGVLQPIVVREQDGRFQIVAGERRWRAARLAGLSEVPALVRVFDEAETLEVALIENIQRQDLNAIEEAEAYQRLLADYGHTQEALGQLVGKSRSHVANLLRLLDLPAAVRQQVAVGALSMGHARALATAPDAAALAAQVVARGLSVRDTEALARGAAAPRARKPREPRAPAVPDADLAALERQLGDLLGLEVRIAHGGPGGAVTLGYATLDQLDMICQRLSGEPI